MKAASDDLLIKNGRYSIVPRGEKKAKPHTRITNFAALLDDKTFLTTWKQRMVGVGIAKNPRIAAAFALATDTAELNRLVELAMEAAGATSARDTGSELHDLMERIDVGGWWDKSGPWDEHVAAYLSCLSDLGATVERVEEVVVLPHLGLAGRFDRILRIDDELFIADLKTGKDLSYSWGSISIQLALYASAASIYNPETKTHVDMPLVNQDNALVLHLPAGKAQCTPYWVDLEAGRKGIEMVKALKACRKEIAKSYSPVLMEVSA